MKRFMLAALLCWPIAVSAQTPAVRMPITAQPGDAALIENCDGLFTSGKTYALARNWIDAWNSTSADRVMALYTPDFEFRTRGILVSTRKSDTRGVLHGQADNRVLWFDPAARGAREPSLFRLVDAYAGVRSIAVHYINAAGEPVVEVNEYTPNCKIERSNAMYGPMPAGIPGPFDIYPASADGIVVAKPSVP